MPTRESPHGWIEVICGCMFSGKTEELLRRIKRAQIARLRVQVFTHGLDLRYGQKRLAAHSGAQAQAVTVSSAAEVLAQLAPDTEVVALDEVQFFDREVIAACEWMADQGLRVISAGLDMDFRGEPFGPMPDVVARAERVDKLQAICMTCGAPASRTQRLIDGRPARYNDPIIMVGANEVYEARCRAHHQVLGKPALGSQAAADAADAKGRADERL